MAAECYNSLDTNSIIQAICNSEMTFRYNTKEIGTKEASCFKYYTISKYFEMIVKWLVQHDFQLLTQLNSHSSIELVDERVNEKVYVDETHQYQCHYCF